MSQRPAVLMAGPFPPPVGGLEWTVESLATSTVLAQDYQVRRLNTTPLPVAWRRPRALKAVSATWVGWQLDRQLRQVATSLLHLHAPWGTEFWHAERLAQVAARHGVPILLHLHSGAMPEWLAGLSPTLQGRARDFFARVARIGVLAPIWLEGLLPWTGSTPIVHLPTGLDLASLGPAPHRSAHPAPYRLLTVGRLERAKGTLDVLAAVALLDPGAYELSMVGRVTDPEVATALAQRTCALPLRLPGELPLQALAEEYRRADAMLFMSHFEGLGIALLEGMAMGLPAITSGIGGIGDILRQMPGNPVCPLGDSRALASAIEALAADPEAAAALGARNAAGVRSYYDTALTHARVAALYAEILEEHNARRPG